MEPDDPMLYDQPVNRSQTPFNFECRFVASEAHVKDDSSEESSSDLFTLIVYKDAEYKVPVRQQDYPVDSYVDDLLFVEARVNSGPALKVVPEFCWLSPNQIAASEERYPLIDNTCPRDPSVEKVKPEEVPLAWTRFRFRLNPNLFTWGSVYLHCSLGICTAGKTSLYNSGPMRVKECQDSEEICRSSDKTLETFG